jgi:hypothetical protein
MSRRPYRKSLPPQEMYVVVNKHGEIFTGLKGGYPEYSSNWFHAKPLFLENTKHLLREHGTELIKESEL